MDDAGLLGRGIYDIAEVARLVRRSSDEIAGWAVATRGRDPLLIPRQRRLLSFYDLVTAFVVAELRRRDVPLRKIRDARRVLAEHYALDWPLAYGAILNKLANVGSDVYVEIDEWIDASAGGQRAFQQVIEPLLHHLTFDAEGMADQWRPRAGVLIAPAVQAGAPCIEGTRITTEFIGDLVRGGEDVADVARDFDLDQAQVLAALEFEQDLRAA